MSNQEPIFNYEYTKAVKLNRCDSGVWVAKTNLRTGVITLHSDFYTMSKVEQQCTLAHELTHFLQGMNRIKFNKVSELEVPAYAVEAACLKMNGYTEAEKWAVDQSESQRNCK